MNAFLTGLIGVAATLLGSFTTYLFQSRAAERSQAFEREERFRQEQLDAAAVFAGAMTELKRGLVTLWFYRQRGWPMRPLARSVRSAAPPTAMNCADARTTSSWP